MVFNSIGSNYSYQFVLKSLFASNNKDENVKLIDFLNRKYNGTTTLLYKGREAIMLALNILDLPTGSKVGITGFTCFVVDQAIVDAGYKPIYIDIEKSSLNFSINELKKHKNLKVLIIQNTFGNPSQIIDINDYCSRHNIYLIEDLAHCIGTLYESGDEAGNYGDFVVLSFSQDKVIDAVSGGALVVRNKKFADKYINSPYSKVGFGSQLKDRIYPLLTFLIRKTYPFGLGKIIHFLVKKLNFLSQPVSNNKKIILHSLPNWYSYLISFQFTKLKEQVAHRNMISLIYSKTIDKRVVSVELAKNLKNSSNLRFTIFSKNRVELIKYLSGLGIHISDIWYDAPIGPKKFLKSTGYSGTCPVSEEISINIVNLPTHINISEADARRVSNNINKWINTQ